MLRYGPLTCAQSGLLRGMQADNVRRLAEADAAEAAADANADHTDTRPYRIVRIDSDPDPDSAVPHAVWCTLQVPAYVSARSRSVM